MIRIIKHITVNIRPSLFPSVYKDVHLFKERNYKDKLTIYYSNPKVNI